MSPLVGSLFLVAMLSAIMSTVNSILLVTGGAVAHDLYKRLVNPQATESRLLWVNRLSIVGLGLVPFWFATQKMGDVQTIVIEQAKFIASFFFVPVVLGLNWRRGTREGAICEHDGRLPRVSALDVHVSAQLRRLTASTRWRSASPSSAVTFVLVSRVTSADACGEPAHLLRRRTVKKRGLPH